VFSLGIVLYEILRDNPFSIGELKPDMNGRGAETGAAVTWLSHAVERRQP
jgi:hypothetical protein